MYGGKLTLYDVLELPRNAKLNDIHRAYRRLSAEQKKETSVPDARKAALLHEAYEVLSDPERRAAYDASLKAPGFLRAARDTARPGFVAGVVAGVVVLCAVLYFTFHAARAPDRPERTAQEVLAATSFSVGRVQSLDLSGRATPIGLAFAIDEGVMVTTCHGLPAGAQLIVSFGSKTAPARLALADETFDVCKLSVDGAASRPLALDAQEPKAGDTVYALASNAAGALRIAEGSVKRVFSDANGKVLELTIPIAAAASGGPLLDAQGRVVGMATAPHAHGQGRHVAIPAARIKEARSRRSQ
jgi:S1-C subfamily serine protease